MLSLPGGDEVNKKQQAAFDARGRQESLLNASERNWSADKVSFSAYFITGPPLEPVCKRATREPLYSDYWEVSQELPQVPTLL